MRLVTVRDLTTVLLFGAFLLTPIVGLVVAPSRQQSSNEKRRLRKAPAVARLFHSPRAFTKELQGYLSDHFYFRHELVKLHSLLMYRLFDQSTVKQVTAGRQGWLFYTASVDTFRTYRHYTRHALDRKCRVLAARAAWSRQRGIHYLFVPAPSKPSIYPERLPPYVRRVLHPSRLRQLLEELDRRGRVRFVDLEPIFAERKRRQRLYYQTDTHWNDTGAFATYEAIIHALERQGPLPLLPAYTVHRRAELYRNGDLSRMLSLEGYIGERTLRLERLGGFRSRPLATGIPGYRHAAHYRTSDHATPRLLFLGDSFGYNTRLGRFLAERFGESIVIRTNEDVFDVALVNRFRPDVIVQQRVERHLEGCFDRNPAALRQYQR